MAVPLLNMALHRRCLLVSSLVLAALILPVRVSRDAIAAPPTAISPSPGAGGLRTIVAPSSAPTNICSANCIITGGTRPGGGGNLFHSFGQFNIGAGDIATFQNGISFDTAGNALAGGLPTANILARVTGGNLSSIYGTIQTSGFGSANLFLMNPAGFLFGPNATVNVGGMMTFTTADYIKLTDNVRFNSIPNLAADALLSAAPVAAFGFLGSNPAAITFDGGQLTVTNGTGLALVGGDIQLMPDSSGIPSSITAHGRPIQLTSVGGPGEVAADTGVPAAGMTLGNITLGQGTIFDSSGDTSFGDGSGSGGSIFIRGGQFVAIGATILTNPALGSIGQGGAVTIAATGSATLTDSFIQTGPVAFDGTGSAGAVSITANESLSLTNTILDASAFSAGGDGGAVRLQTNGPLSLIDTFIGTLASAPGNGGDVTIAGKDVTFTRSAVFTDVDAGSFDLATEPNMGLVHPGSVTVTAKNTVTFSGSYADDPGTFPVISTRSFDTLLDAGSVTIAGNIVNVSNGSINVSNSSGKGIPSTSNAGNIEIRGNDINLSQFTITSDNAYGFSSTGKGGNILLGGIDSHLANNIQLMDSLISASSVSTGGSGNVEFQTQELTLNNTIVQADAFAPGPAGSISVHGAQIVRLQSKSLMDTTALVSLVSPSGPIGPAGAILIESQQLTMDGGSQLKASDAPLSRGNAGSITVRGTNGPAQSILIDGTSTGIFTDAEGNGAGGNINLFTNSLTLQSGGTLSAITTGTVPTATGGSILVNANTVTLTTGASMTAASTGAGASGEVIVQGLASPAQSILIDGSGSGIFTNTSGTGAGGNVFVNANSVTLQNGSHISSSSTGTGIAGDVTINAGNQFAMTNSTVTTEANQSGGGIIKITTNPNGTVQLTDSTISASVLDGNGGGGSVNIDPQSVVLINSQILAQAVQGPGGNINITTNLLLPDSTSVISASSQFGQQGTVIIQSPISPASGKIVPLGQKPLLPTSLLSQRCAAIAGGNISSFTVAGRDSLPAEPGGWLPSPLALSIAGSEEDTVREADRVTEDETPLLSLRKIAPPGFLTQTFAVGSSDCQS